MGQGTGGGGGRGGGVAKGAQLGCLVVAGVSLRANIHLVVNERFLGRGERGEVEMLEQPFSNEQESSEKSRAENDGSESADDAQGARTHSLVLKVIVSIPRMLMMMMMIVACQEL